MNLEKNMNGNFSEDFLRMKTKLSDLKADQRVAENKIIQIKETLKNLKEDKKHTEEARGIIQIVSEETLKNLEFHLSAIPTMALKAIDPDSPTEVFEMITKRNQVEAAIYFDDNGNKDTPIDSSGGGLLGIAGFGNRITLWSLDKNRSVFLLDEPFKDLSEDRHANASELLNRMTKELNIQIIMVSHQTGIHSEADKIFEITKKKGKSIVEEK